MVPDAPGRRRQAARRFRHGRPVLIAVPLGRSSTTSPLIRHRCPDGQRRTSPISSTPRGTRPRSSGAARRAPRAMRCRYACRAIPRSPTSKYIQAVADTLRRARHTGRSRRVRPERRGWFLRSSEGLKNWAGRWCAMPDELIKVDRVRSAEEAGTVEGLGAGLVGVALAPDPRFDDDRTVTVEHAAAIGAALRSATLVAALELGDDPDRVL